jgi:hypothetical protein
MRIREANDGDAAPSAALWTEAYTRQHPAEGRRDPDMEGDLCEVPPCSSPSPSMAN